MSSPKSVTLALFKNRRKDDNGMVKATILSTNFTEFEISQWTRGRSHTGSSKQRVYKNANILMKGEGRDGIAQTQSIAVNNFVRNQILRLDEVQSQTE
jgi:hypothetical protein